MAQEKNQSFVDFWEGKKGREIINSAGVPSVDSEGNILNTYQIY